MTIEQAIVEKLRLLPVEKQQAVLDFDRLPDMEKREVATEIMRRTIKVESHHTSGGLSVCGHAVVS
jgi:hypothetical protein